MDTRIDESWREFNPRGCIKCRRGEIHYHVHQYFTWSSQGGLDLHTDFEAVDIPADYPDTAAEWRAYKAGCGRRPVRPWLQHPETADTGPGDNLAA